MTKITEDHLDPVAASDQGQLFDDRLPDEDQFHQGGLPHPLGAQFHGEEDVAAYPEVVADIAQKLQVNHQKENE